MSASKRLDPMWLAAAVACVALVGCVRPPLPGSCPQLTAGDLVISELRGSQAGSYKQWLELYNPGDAPVAVQGLRVSFTRLDGTGTVGFVVRDEALEIAPGAYLVLGGGDPQDEDYIDYDYTADFHGSDPNVPRSLYGSATLELEACDVLVDRVAYAGLPAEGTLALDGAAAPDASSNDDSKRGWCVDVRVTEGPQTEIGLRGSPGEANPPCP